MAPNCAQLSLSIYKVRLGGAQTLNVIHNPPNQNPASEPPMTKFKRSSVYVPPLRELGPKLDYISIGRRLSHSRDRREHLPLSLAACCWEFDAAPLNVRQIQCI
jgi:hypothetical protein